MDTDKGDTRRQFGGGGGFAVVSGMELNMLLKCSKLRTCCSPTLMLQIEPAIPCTCYFGEASALLQPFWFVQKYFPCST